MTTGQRIMRLAFTGIASYRVPLVTAIVTAMATAFHPAASVAVIVLLAAIAVVDGILNAPGPRE